MHSALSITRASHVPRRSATSDNWRYLPYRRATASPNGPSAPAAGPPTLRPLPSCASRGVQPPGPPHARGTPRATPPANLNFRGRRGNESPRQSSQTWLDPARAYPSSRECGAQGHPARARPRASVLSWRPSQSNGPLGGDSPQENEAPLPLHSIARRRLHWTSPRVCSADGKCPPGIAAPDGGIAAGAAAA